MAIPDASASGYPAAILRFAIFVPFGIYYATAGQHWTTIRKHDILQHAPYSPSIGHGELIAARWTKIGFYWNFAIWIPNIIFPGPLVFLVGVFDTAIATMLSLALNSQTKHSPHTFGTCKWGGAETWQVPNGTESFFTVAGRLNSTVASSERMCRDYVQEWKYSMAIVTLYWTIALCNLAFSIISTVSAAKSSTPQSFRKNLIDSAMALPRLIFFILMGLSIIPIIIFRCLPLPIKSRFRFGTRYTVKATEVLPPPEEIKMRMMRPTPIPPSHTRYDTHGAYEQSPNPLADFLNYDILVLIARDLHYVDLINLSLTSKSMRDVVFPGTDHAARSDHFALYTCEPDSKTECWNCTMQTCRGCGFWSHMPQTATLFHLDGCEPYCSSCYFSNVCARKGKAMDNTKCVCAPKPPPSWWKRIMYGETATRVQVAASGTAPSRLLCAMCWDMGSLEVAQRREERTKAELRDPNRCKTCAKCGLGLGRGVRWWVHKQCGKECRSRLHLPWGILGKGRDEEG
ncbi:uncharacterized protein BDZ99DRAFT_573960 [Mytilinidion resinicola]|uniref:F-box domain-containing protein n=1 Tax=Mytilinidion resinicola TaxID=574789 RepID=A0A6A6YD07_9PEZI|nr:uncharacterized protein BDZ99DRAFT_573960 [Mytilinidion resinicola]KAF2806448.1 hypothetical protein BDZ99DRAFT_573960 [Mytilinidion resinicola]